MHGGLLSGAGRYGGVGSNNPVDPELLDLESLSAAEAEAILAVADG
jgi:hypothetical protein